MERKIWPNSTKVFARSYRSDCPYNEGAFLGNPGNAYRALGQVKKAVDYLKQSLAIFEEIKSPNAEWARQLLSDIEME